MLYKKILVVANPKAGSGNVMTILSQFIELLENNGLSYYSYLTVQGSNQKNIQRLIEVEQCDLVSVIGGDGTVNIVLNSIKDLNIPLHLIPAGIGNDLATMLYPYGPNVKNAFRVIGNYATTKVDIWRCNDYRFCLAFGVGFDGEIAHRVERKSNYVFRQSKYWIEIIRLILRYKERQLKVNGVLKECFMLSMVNGVSLGGSFNIAPRASISDQLIDFICVSKSKVWKRLYYLARIKIGKHLNLSVVEYAQLNQTLITSDQKIPAHIDGEPILDNSYRISFEGIAQFVA